MGGISRDFAQPSARHPRSRRNAARKALPAGPKQTPEAQARCARARMRWRLPEIDPDRPKTGHSHQLRRLYVRDPMGGAETVGGGDATHCGDTMGGGHTVAAATPWIGFALRARGCHVGCSPERSLHAPSFPDRSLATLLCAKTCRGRNPSLAEPCPHGLCCPTSISPILGAPSRTRSRHPKRAQGARARTHWRLAPS